MTTTTHEHPAGKPADPDCTRCATLRARADWPAGTRVTLTAHGDAPGNQAPSANLLTQIEIGTHGTVVLVDSLGTVHVAWDSERTLGVCFDDGDKIAISAG